MRALVIPALATARIALIGAAFALAPAGCGDAVKAPGSAQPDPLPGDQYPKVEAAEGLSQYLVVSGVNVTPATEAKPMWVTAAVRAKTEYQELNVQYRYFFFDARNNPLTTNPDWQFARLPSRSQVFLQGGAIDTRAVDWRLQIRPAR